MKITQNQKIVLIIMIIVISLILYNMYFRKSEHASSIPIDEKLELVKNANNIKNTITSDDTRNLNTSNIFLLASNVINSIQYLFFIYNNAIGIIKVNLSTGKIELSKHVNITKQSVKILFKLNGDLVIKNINDDINNLYATNTVNKKFNTLSLQFDGLTIINSPYLVFTNINTGEKNIYLIDRMIDDINIYLSADIIENNLPSQLRGKIEKYLFEYNDKSIISTPTLVPQQVPQQAPQQVPQQEQTTPYYNLNCNIDLNNKETPVIKSCSILKYN